MARLLVGLPALRGKLEGYARRYDMLEVRPGDEPLPRAAGLKAWREAVKPSFAFSVVLPRLVGELQSSPDVDEALTRALEAATALQASCLVLATPASVRPTPENRARVAALAARLPASGHVLCWQPAGMWEPDDLFDTAQRAGLLPVLDAVRDPLPPGPIVYTRIRALGGAKLGPQAIARIAEQLAGRRDSYVVAEPPLALKLRARLHEALREGGGRRPVPMLFRPGESLALDDYDEEQ